MLFFNFLDDRYCCETLKNYRIFGKKNIFPHISSESKLQKQHLNLFFLCIKKRIMFFKLKLDDVYLWLCKNFFKDFFCHCFYNNLMYQAWSSLKLLTKKISLEVVVNMNIWLYFKCVKYIFYDNNTCIVCIPSWILKNSKRVNCKTKELYA